MTEWVRHNGDCNSPVDVSTIVTVKTVNESIFGNVYAGDCEWESIVSYKIVRGWTKPIQAIFAEIPDTATHICVDSHGRIHYAEHPINKEPFLGGWSGYYLYAGNLNAHYVGCWVDSLTKRTLVSIGENKEPTFEDFVRWFDERIGEEKPDLATSMLRFMFDVFRKEMKNEKS